MRYMSYQMPTGPLRAFVCNTRAVIQTGAITKQTMVWLSLRGAQGLQSEMAKNDSLVLDVGDSAHFVQYPV